MEAENGPSTVSQAGFSSLAVCVMKEMQTEMISSNHHL